MSRIHEALRRAAQEQSAHPDTNKTEDLLDALARTSKDTCSRLEPATTEKLEPSRVIGQLNPTYESFIAKCRRLPWEITTKYSAFVGKNDNAGGAERFRTLRSRLYQVNSVTPLRRLLLTSSVPEEGKTFVASNLAQCIVRQPDRKVLLIDADLRASRLHLTLGTKSGPGLSDYLMGEKELTEIIQLGEADNFCFIPGGRYVTTTSEILHSEKMKLLLEKMGELFDWVILDSPPAIPVHDASILADMCDGVLYVVRAGSTDYEVAQKGASEFENKNLLGVILNRVEIDDAYGFDYYYARD